MSREGEHGPETGLRDVYDILVRTPSERLLSLTIQLGESPEDTVVHALCLIILQKEAQALSKLQTLEDDSLACHLAEKWQRSGGEREDFGEHCGRFKALTGESLATLARIFKVLAQQRLCDPMVRNLAYKRAISSDCQKTCTYDDTCYDQFREEAKDVCGPEFVEWLYSSAAESESHSGSHRSLDEGMTSLKVNEPQTQSASTRCFPSPLEAGPSVISFPTHLEISIPPTIPFRSDRFATEASGNLSPGLPAPSPSEEEATKPPEPPRPLESTGSSQCEAKKDSMVAETTTTCRSNLTSEQTKEPSLEPKYTQPSATNISQLTLRNSKEMHESEDAEEDEEVFYAFVILHAPEDAEVAETMREKLENAAGCHGATFSSDFAIPGRSTLGCVEDAINNSAFAFLLLTRNFNTRMLNMKTNTALTNSINKTHKYNTVIPLLPKENRMPPKSLPLVLQTIIALEENNSFVKKIQKVLSPAKIRKQREEWTEEQRLKTQRLAMQRRRQQESDGAPARYSTEPDQDGGDGRNCCQNICIQNAKYILIGNDSQMNVGLPEGANQEDSGDTE